MTRIPIDDDNELTDETGQDQPGREAAGSPGAAATDDVQRLREERDAFYDRWVRSKADAENMRKRLQSEFDQRCQYANQSLIKSLLPVIDNFERALAQDASKVDAAAILKGMQIVHDQWLAVLSQQAVQPIAPKAGDPFDPNTMQALMQQPTNQYPENHVTQLLGKGYSQNGRTLRPAQVAVSKSA